MQQTLIQLQPTPQDLQVHSNNCCQAIVKSKLNSSQEILSLSPRKRNSQNGKERGIKLTNTKSRTLLTSTKKIKQEEKTTSCGNSQKLHIKKNNSTKPTEQSKETENINSNSTKKCIEYKNRRIIQRTTTESSYVYTYNTDSSAKRSKQKTQDFTPRTTIKTEQEYAELSQVIDKNYQFLMILSNKYNNNPETEMTKLFFKANKNKKTLSRLYEQQLGRRVLTVQSQQNDTESDHLSIIQPYEWRIELN